MKINQEITTEQQRLDLIKELQSLEIKKGLSKSWEELGEIKGFVLKADGSIGEIDGHGHSDWFDRAFFATKAQAESSRAYAMLTQLMQEANGDWVADWSDGEQWKYNVAANSDKIHKTCYVHLYQPISLKSEEIRDEFHKNHEELIKTFYQIK
jgi:hypothetical protein